MVQLSPDNGRDGWEFCSGYHRSADVITGFSHVHLSGTGKVDGGDVSLMPVRGDVALARASRWRSADALPPNYGARFTHDDEAATPGYYRVALRGRAAVELTATERTGMHAYAFEPPPEGSSSSFPDSGTLPQGAPGLVLNLGHGSEGDRSMFAFINVTSARSAVGCRVSKGWADDHRVFFALELSTPAAGVQLAADGAEVGGRVAEGQNAGANFLFSPPAAGSLPFTLLVKVGLSSASVEGALEALRSENPGWDFDAVRRRAAAAWEAELGKVRVEGGNEMTKRVFYTALYHTKLAPTLHSDARGEYWGPDSAVRRITPAASQYYSTFSLWDTFRAAQPLFTLLNPDRVPDMLRSLLAHAEASGLALPVWLLAGQETNVMPGYHSAVVLAEAAAKGLLTAGEAARAFAAMNATARRPARDDSPPSQMGSRGWVSAETPASVTLTLELGYDDWCIATVAQRLGHAADATYFFNRSRAYRSLFDPSTGFMRGRHADGSWRVPFDPRHSDHEFGDYTEGNAWQYSWFVPHDIPGLVALHGGPAAFEAKLDALFAADSRVTGEKASPDISGMIGQYAHGNEPSHHVAYLYNYAGAPAKTQARVRSILDTQYSAAPDGLSGNEDCGQMSAWFVFSALGFYPVNPAEARYQLGSPLFDRAVVDVGPGRFFEVRAPGASEGKMYVVAARLNGAALGRTYLEHSEVVAGGVLELEMSAEPAAAAAAVAGVSAARAAAALRPT